MSHTCCTQSGKSEHSKSWTMVPSLENHRSRFWDWYLPSLQSTNSNNFTTTVLHYWNFMKADALCPAKKKRQHPVCAKRNSRDVGCRLGTKSRRKSEGKAEKVVEQCNKELKDLLVYIKFCKANEVDKQTTLNTAHFVSEFFPFQPPRGVFRSIVNSFSSRFTARSMLSRLEQQDKTHNPLTALPATMGLGKSTIMANMARSKEYADYHVSRQRCQIEALRVSVERPLVACVSFNSSMGLYGEGNTLGLRILYGAVCHALPEPPDWADFCERYVHLKTVSARSAIELLRYVFGLDRLLLICVDELSKAGKEPKDANDCTVQAIMRELGLILNKDGRTDILVSALSPQYAHDLVTGSNRPIDYIPVPLLARGELHEEFRNTVKREIAAITGLVNDRFQKNLLGSLDLLTSGHPRMLQFLSKFFMDKKMMSVVQQTLRTSSDVSALDLMRGISLSELVTPLATYASEPVDDNERELVLSVRPRSAKTDKLFREMLEGSRCFIHEQVGEASSLLFRVTSTLSIFFQVLRTINRTSNTDLGPLSLAAKALFAATQRTVERKKSHVRTILPQVSDLWECSRGLSVVSRVNYLIFDAIDLGCVPAHQVYGINTDTTKFNFDLELRNDLRVVLARSAADMLWQNHTLFLAPKHHSGFDLVLCVPDKYGNKVYIYEETIVEVSASQTSIEHIAADKLLRTVRYHLQLFNLTKDYEQQQKMQLKKQLALLQNVAFLLSVYGCEGPLNQDSVLQYMQAAEHDPDLGPFVIVSCLFAKQCWSRVAFLGTAEMDASMLPVVLPVARLVQAVDDEVEVM